MNRTIKVFHTHIEIFPYEKGDFRKLEERLSVWDDQYYCFEPVAYYIEDGTLYVPRGTSISYIKSGLPNCDVVVDRSYDRIDKIRISSKLLPKSNIQADAVDFLCSVGKFTKGIGYSQRALTLDTGDGKTIAAILAIANTYKCKSLVITHTSKLRTQWFNEFLKATDVSEDDLLILDSSDDMKKIIENNGTSASAMFVTHQLINSFGRNYGWEGVREFFKTVGIGVKIIDEAHKYFNNSCMIDFFSNTYNTFYLSATFDRNNNKEKSMFKRAYNNCYKFGDETLNYTSKRKHVIYYYTQFNSECPLSAESKMFNKYSISPFKYIEYELYGDDSARLLTCIYTIISKMSEYDGKILITSPLIESTRVIGDFIDRHFPDKRVCVANSETKAQLADFMKADIISSTVKYLGTGDDIKGLRCIINTEPFSSKDNMRQLKGRLREFSPTDYTYFFDLVDTSISKVVSMGESRLSVMKKYALSVREIHM